MAKFHITPAGQRDLRKIGRWYKQEGGQALADRFTIAAQRAFDMLGETPGLGAPAEARSPDIALARRWRIEGFPYHRVFYAPHFRGGVTILRLLHTSQDWKRR